jgi:hypothetical protein
MDSSLSGLIGAGATALIGLVLSFGAVGGLVNSHPRYWLVAMCMARLAVCVTGAYPILWAHHSPYLLPVIAVAAGAWGAVMGALWYVIGLWYRWELSRPQSALR